MNECTCGCREFEEERQELETQVAELKARLGIAVKIVGAHVPKDEVGPTPLCAGSREPVNCDLLSRSNKWSRGSQG